MADIEITLLHGLKIGEEILTAVVVKDHLTAAEVRDASRAAEQLVMVEVPGTKDREPMLVVSPTLMAHETLRRQIKSIGNIQGPISLAELGRLHEDDLFLLNQVADNLERIKTSKEVAQRGRPDAGSDD